MYLKFCKTFLCLLLYSNPPKFTLNNLDCFLFLLLFIFQIKTRCKVIGILIVLHKMMVILHEAFLLYEFTTFLQFSRGYGKFSLKSVMDGNHIFVEIERWQICTMGFFICIYISHSCIIFKLLELIIILIVGVELLGLRINRSGHVFRY